MFIISTGLSARVVVWSLAALWITGLAVIWLDTQFVWNVLISKPKLMAKLTIVTILTVNGMALHWLAFPRLQAAHSCRLRGATLPAILGGVSGVTWMYAAFVGVGKAAVPVLGYYGFVGLYAVALAGAVGVAMIIVRPRIAAQLRAIRTPVAEQQQ